MLCFWTLSIVLSLSKNTVLTLSCLFFKQQRFGDWILSPELYRLGPTEQVLPEDGDRIQSPKRCSLKNKQEDDFR
jgi:hypothetical protein